MGFETERQEMVKTIRKVYGLDDEKVLSVMLQIPREEFAPEESREVAYDDAPVSIGFGQTMSQPYTVAFMTHLAISGKRYTRRNTKVLEIGTGSGYQAAVLSKLFKEVYTVEIIPELARRAKKTLKKLGFRNVYVKVGSGEWGWEEKAPFDAIIVTAGIEDDIPKELLEQLKVGGVFVAPIGRGYDKIMTRLTKLGKEKPKSLENLKIERCGRIVVAKEEFGIFHFVPFVREKN